MDKGDKRTSPRKTKPRSLGSSFSLMWIAGAVRRGNLSSEQRLGRKKGWITQPQELAAEGTWWERCRGEKANTKYRAALCCTLPYYTPSRRDHGHGGEHAMWPVGMLVQPGFKPEGGIFFLTTSIPKENFTNVRSQMPFPKETLYNMVFMHCFVSKSVPVATI